MFLRKYLLSMCALAASGLLQAQNAPAPPQRDNVMFVARDTGVATMQAQFIGGEFNYDKLVKNAPYTADAVSETTQTLADGNRIVHKSTTSLARDSAGRTRREETMGAVGPWSTGGSAGETPKIVFINDPVTHMNYVLEPNHVARAMKVSSGSSDLEGDRRGKSQGCGRWGSRHAGWRVFGRCAPAASASGPRGRRPRPGDLVQQAFR